MKIRSLSERVGLHMKAAARLIPPERVVPAAFSMENRRCHLNSVAAVRGERADSVWMVWQEQVGGGCVHFINKKDGKFFDETRHEYDDPWKYYVFRKVQPSEYGSIGTLLTETKEALCYQFGSWRDKLKMRRKDTEDLGI